MQKSIEIDHKGQILRGMQHIPIGNKLPAVILFHGFTGTKLEPHRFFLKISRALETMGIASFRFDFLGSGESDGNFEEMTVLSEVSEAKAILESVQSHPSVDKNNIIVLGFSMGGLVASLLAGDHSAEIKKLILLAPAGTLPEIIEKQMGFATFIEELNAYDLGGNLLGKEFVTELKSLEVWEKAARYTNDVLLIHGTNDQAVHVKVSSLYQQNCYPNATLKHIEGADHTFNSYKWEKEVIEAICNFCG
ncbi:pimeloyl-ACP methyl ester carboxylesterase [Bacillus tianshenii]|uniref:Pimeloyl-ACP methyl ester carboxylesterase n=1 Tax=Sutcliffiella tianshenii TaxID=1463404 RepID=A0ABS2NWZ3_9BACI|nr:alpha/beta fold hydrolase [Bacillus tianshenii]MBM7619161.1 pimeloyl-ACP methyl ester carboxylesterase [Bacillus tianshenii]